MADNIAVSICLSLLFAVCIACGIKESNGTRTEDYAEQ